MHPCVSEHSREFARAPNVANVLCYEIPDCMLVCMSVNGPFASTDDQDALLKNALPADEVEWLSELFKKETRLFKRIWMY